METPLVLPQASGRPGFRGTVHPGCSALTVWAVNAVLGAPVYFVAFLFAYGFRDSIGWSEHVAFLVPIAAFAVITGILAMSVAALGCAAAAFRILSFGILASLAINAAVVGLGSIVSASNKDQGSVSADFSTTTDVVLALSLLGFAAACAFAADRVRRT